MKFKHILFPVDFSGRTRYLDAEVERMANHYGSRVTLLHVFEVPTAWYGPSDAPLITTESFGAFLEVAKQRLKNYRIQVPEDRVQRFVAEGDAGWTVASWAAENDVDLIMMGTHGYGRIRGMLLGSVTAKVIHDAHCPVWTDSSWRELGNGPKPGISNILCAVDADEEAVSLLQTAGQLAREFSAGVHVLHAVPGPESRPNKYLEFDLHQYLLDVARVEISKAQRAAGVAFPIHIRKEPVAKAVAELAIEKGCDLVLIGRGKAQEGLGRLRTHTYQIIRDAPCPVLSCSPHPQDHIFSSYSAAHPAQSEDGEPLLIGSPQPSQGHPQ
jgi:nucleotide-binding universal stress UspA family protein